MFSNYNADGEWLDFSSTPQAPSGGMSYLVADRTEGKEKAEWEKVHVRRVLLQRRKEMVMRKPASGTT